MKENKKNAKINFSQVEGIKNKDLSPKNSTSQIYNNFYSINSDESINIPIKVINLYKQLFIGDYSKINLYCYLLYVNYLILNNLFIILKS